MSFLRELFTDDNNINEKSVIGFASFTVMSITIIINLITGYLGKELVLNEYIFNAFMVITLGSLGIGSVDKFINKKADNDRAKIIIEQDAPDVYPAEEAG